MTVAVYDLETSVWRVPDDDALPFFEDQGLGSEYRKKWPRAGSIRKGVATALEGTKKPGRGSPRLWPTPAASLPNDGEEPAQWLQRFVRNATKKKGATRASVPLSVAARAPSILHLARIGNVDEAREALRKNEEDPDPELSSRDKLNPEWVEHLMGFPPGWTETD